MWVYREVSRYKPLFEKKNTSEIPIFFVSEYRKLMRHQNEKKREPIYFELNAQFELRRIVKLFYQLPLVVKRN